MAKYIDLSSVVDVEPQWLGKEVTQDTTYYNSTLSKTSWKAIQKSYAEAKAWEDWRDSLVKG